MQRSRSNSNSKSKSAGEAVRARAAALFERGPDGDGQPLTLLGNPAHDKPVFDVDCTDTYESTEPPTDYQTRAWEKARDAHLDTIVLIAHLVNGVNPYAHHLTMSIQPYS